MSERVAANGKQWQASALWCAKERGVPVELAAQKRSERRTDSTGAGEPEAHRPGQLLQALIATLRGNGGGNGRRKTKR
jgi:hypothetical protein